MLLENPKRGMGCISDISLLPSSSKHTRKYKSAMVSILSPFIIHPANYNPPNTASKLCRSYLTYFVLIMSLYLS